MSWRDHEPVAVHGRACQAVNYQRSAAPGIDVLTAQEDGLASQPDIELLRRASDLGRVLFTQDEDFLSIAHDLQISGEPFSGIIYAHQLSITVGEATRQLTIVCAAATAEEMMGTILYLPL